jgi:hypothetical protein
MLTTLVDPRLYLGDTVDVARTAEKLRPVDAASVAYAE